MEIKDAIISTLAEIEEITNEVRNEAQKAKKVEEKTEEKVVKKAASNNGNAKVVARPAQQPQKNSYPEHHRVEELEYLKSVRDRVLVLFEGLQAPTNQELEKKVDLILKFMEFQLATIDERIKNISKK